MRQIDELYTPGRILADDEYLLKIKEPNGFSDDRVGFLTKLNKDGTVPVRFSQWPTYKPPLLPIHVVEETFREGWQIKDCRFGESRNWAILLHPDGYTLEIHMTEFIDLLKTITVKDGILIGQFKWSRGKLLQPFKI